MLREVGRAGRRPAARQVVRGGGQHDVRGGQAAHDHAGVELLQADEDAGVEALFDQVDVVVGQRHVEHHAGRRLREARQQPGQLRLAEGGMAVDAQRAARLLRARRGGGLGVVDVEQDLAHPLQVVLAGFGQRQAARGAVQEARAEMGFQVGDIARHDRRRHAQRGRSAGKTALVDHLGEHPHRHQPVHPCLHYFASRNYTLPGMPFIAQVERTRLGAFELKRSPRELQGSISFFGR